MKKLCPCHSNKQYSDCCQIFHQNLDYPNNQETLMRSRYSAYALELFDYLIKTWHTTTCPQEFNNMHNLRWIGLKICSISENLERKEYFVEFIARFKDSINNGKADKIHEISRFIEEDGRLVYIDGIFK